MITTIPYRPPALKRGQKPSGEAEKAAALGWVVARTIPGSKHSWEKWASVGYRDPDEVKSLWNEQRSGTAVLCGPSDLVCIDIDLIPGGEASLAKLLKGRELPKTFEQSTPSGGRHLVFRQPVDGPRIGSQNDWRPGIDIKGDGGLFILHDPIKDYTLTANFHPAELPDWLIRELPKKGDKGEKGNRPEGNGSGKVDVRNLLETGQVHDTLYRLAWMMRNAGLSRDLFLSIAGAVELAPHHDGPPYTREDIEHEWDSADGKVPEREDDILGRVLKRSELKALPKPEPLIEEWLDLRTAVIMPGDTGTYKTFTLIGWACSIATGADWLGHKVKGGPFPALMVVGEGGSGMDNRITAWETEHGITVPDNMLTISLLPGSINDAKFWKAVTAKALALGARFVSLDTLSSLAPDVDEVKDAARIIRWMTDLAIAIDGIVILAHHTGWAAKNRARNASQFEANPDSVIILQKDDDPDEPRSIWRKKDKEGPDGLKLWVRLKPMAESCVLELTDQPAETGRNGDETATASEISGAIQDYLKAYPWERSMTAVRTAIKGQLSIGQTRFDQEWQGLVDSGRITRDEKGKWGPKPKTRVNRTRVRLGSDSGPRPPETRDRPPDPTRRVLGGPSRVRSGSEKQNRKG